MIPQYIAMMIQAVSQIRPEFVTNCHSISNEYEIKYLDERTFAYEFYRQWGNLIEDTGEDMVVNAEVPKKIQKVKFLRELINIFGLTKKGKPHCRFYPDIVFHHSQFNSDKQEIICEIKTREGIDDSKNIKLNQDLKKLAAYMTKDILLCYPFKYGVFILVGESLSEIKNRYVYDNFVEKKANEIYCLSYNIRQTEGGCYVPDIICMSLNELLQLK